MSEKSRKVVLALGLVGLLADAIAAHPGFGDDKVSLYRVTTQRRDLVIGLTKDELHAMKGRAAEDFVSSLNDNGAMNVWQYSVRQNSRGELEQAPLRPVNLLAGAVVRVEPYKTPLHIVAINEETMH